jgi:hypothetical protein
MLSVIQNLQRQMTGLLNIKLQSMCEVNCHGPL